MGHQDEPLYMSIYQNLLSRISSGDLGPGARLPTEKELEVAFEVSRITASRALRELEVEGLIVRRRGAGSFVREAGAPTKGLDFISLVIPFGGDFSSGLLAGVEEVARRHECFVTFHDSGEDPAQDRAIAEGLLAKGSRGLVLYPSSETANLDLYSSLLIRRLPFVLLDRRLSGLDAPIVSVDNRDAFRLATEHLFTLGHRRVAFVGNSIARISSEMERYRGFCQAHLDRGIPLLSDHLFLAEDPRGMPEEYLPGEREESREAGWFFERLALLPPESRPTALAAVNDVVARELLLAATRRGIAVPGDYSISGFDDLPFASHLTVPLTTIRQPTRELGRAAAELLFEIAEGRAGGVPSRVLPASLVARSSTGPAPTPPVSPAQRGGEA